MSAKQWTKGTALQREQDRREAAILEEADPYLCLAYHFTGHRVPDGRTSTAGAMADCPAGFCRAATEIHPLEALLIDLPDRATEKQS